MHVMNIIDVTGHTTVQWVETDEAQVQAAQEQFDALVQQGYTMYTREPSGTGEVIRDFDPAAREIIARPRMVGG